MSNLNLDQAGIDLIASEEGLKLHPYLDSVGIATIGYGSTHYENGQAVTMNDPAITMDRAKQLLLFWSKNKIAGVNHVVTSDINQNQFNALVSFSYNGGVGMLQNSHLLIKVNANPDDPTIADEFRKFVYGHDKSGAPIKIQGLINRREKEQAMYFKPISPENTAIHGKGL